MGKKTEKLLKKSIFLNNIKSLKEAVNSEKPSSEKFQYRSREDYLERLFKIIMEKKTKDIPSEDLLV